jgi:hypothetical protein
MTKKSEIILVVSDSMDNNKKPDRNEQGLIRCSGPVRKALSFPGPIIDVIGKKDAVELKVHQAFTKDLQALRASGKFSEAQLNRLGFVTSDVFKRLSNNRLSGALPATFGAPKPKKILVGADPEFLLFDGDGNVVHANNYMQKNGPIGSDGAMMEVRPNPSHDPNKVVRSIREIFADSDLTDRISEFDWKAEVYYANTQRDFPVGGHIHIGNPTGISRLAASERRYLFAVVNKIIDELLSVPMIKLDGKIPGNKRRTNCKYVPDGNDGFGFFGGWRECAGHLEHRTLSGLWLMHPTLAYFVLGTAKAIAEAAYDIVVSEGFSTSTFVSPSVDVGQEARLYSTAYNDWHHNKLAEALGCVQKSSELKTWLHESMTGKITKTYLNNWRNHMKSLSTYGKYAACIDGLYDVLKVSVATLGKNVGTDLKKNWLEGNEFTL